MYLAIGYAIADLLMLIFSKSLFLKCMTTVQSQIMEVILRTLLVAPFFVYMYFAYVDLKKVDLEQLEFVSDN